MLECRLRTKDFPSLVGAWRYGEPLEGYEMQGCGPLHAGATYQVSTVMAPAGSRAVVTIEANGNFVTQSGACD